jgi:hypothetical protein
VLKNPRTKAELDLHSWLKIRVEGFKGRQEQVSPLL